MKHIILTIGMLIAFGGFEAYAQDSSTPEDAKHTSKRETLDTDKDGKISRAEYLARAAKRFEHVDSNNDGFLSKEEMRSMKKDHMQHMKRKKERMIEKRREATGS